MAFLLVSCLPFHPAPSPPIAFTLHASAPYSAFLKQLKIQFHYRGKLLRPTSHCHLYLFPQKKALQIANNTPIAQTTLYHLSYQIDFCISHNTHHCTHEDDPASRIQSIHITRYLPLPVTETRYSNGKFATLRNEMQQEAILRLMMVMDAYCGPHEEEHG